MVTAKGLLRPTGAVTAALLCMSAHLQAYVLQAGDNTTPKKGFVCWTCPNKTDNLQCNNWAPDVACPTNYTVCHTLHRFSMTTGRSMLVTKRCARPADCGRAAVGCRETSPGVKQCVSCCNKAYCNRQVALNDTMATSLSASVLNLASPLDVRWSWTVSLLSHILLQSHWR